MSRFDDYELVALKRDWVPEWLFFWCNAFGAVAWFPPLRWLVTRKVDDEHVHDWSCWEAGDEWAPGPDGCVCRDCGARRER